MEWWKKAVIYQIYPRSFYDTTGNGIGDLRGIIEKLDYLSFLGIDAIWLSPVYESPQYDNGYDISNYESIDEMFGTMEDMENLIQEAHRHHIKIVMDLVVNHTSFQHPWFIESKNNLDSKYRDFYIWRDTANELQSTFGGSAWQFDEETGQYYFHLFTPEQPDLNWENSDVRQEIYQMMQRWADKGIDGFRMDVIDLIGKNPDAGITNNGPLLHDYLYEMNQQVLEPNQLMTVGETWGATPKIAKQYSSPQRHELSMVFQFEHVTLDQKDGNKWDVMPLDFVELKRVFDKWQNELEQDGWNSLFWNNHDLPRAVSHFGNDSDEYRVKSAKMLAIVLHMQKGTPYIYQGEEIGMTNTPIHSVDEINDIESQNFYDQASENGWNESRILDAININGRDNARRPMAWNSDVNGGFTTGTPWLSLNPAYTQINVSQALEDSNSIFYFYKQLIKLRHDYLIITEGDFEDILPDHPTIYAYTRTLNHQKWLILANFSDQFVKTTLDFKVKKVILSNDEIHFDTTTLNPYEAVVYEIDEGAEQ